MVQLAAAEVVRDNVRLSQRGTGVDVDSRDECRHPRDGPTATDFIVPWTIVCRRLVMAAAAIYWVSCDGCDLDRKLIRVSRPGARP